MTSEQATIKSLYDLIERLRAERDRLAMENARLLREVEHLDRVNSDQTHELDWLRAQREEPFP